MSAKRVALVDRIHREMVRDFLRWPEHSLRFSYMNPAGIARILAERAEWLATEEGREALRLATAYRAAVS